MGAVMTQEASVVPGTGAEGLTSSERASEWQDPVWIFRSSLLTFFLLLSCRDATNHEAWCDRCCLCGSVIFLLATLRALVSRSVGKLRVREQHQGVGSTIATCHIPHCNANTQDCPQAAFSCCLPRLQTTMQPAGDVTMRPQHLYELYQICYSSSCSNESSRVISSQPCATAIAHVLHHCALLGQWLPTLCHRSRTGRVGGIQCKVRSTY